MRPIANDSSELSEPQQKKGYIMPCSVHFSPRTSAWLISFATGLLILGAGFLWLAGCVTITLKDAFCLLLDGVAIAAIAPTAAALFDWLGALANGWVSLGLVTTVGSMALLGLINILQLWDFTVSPNANAFNFFLCLLAIIVLGGSNFVCTVIYERSLEKLEASPRYR